MEGCFLFPVEQRSSCSNVDHSFQPAQDYGLSRAACEMPTIRAEKRLQYIIYDDDIRCFVQCLCTVMTSAGSAIHGNASSPRVMGTTSPMNYMNERPLC
jgi:hypothetical protein